MGSTDLDGTPIADMPTTTVPVEPTEHDGRHADGAALRLRLLAQIEQLVSKGMVEGLRQAVGQMDAMLAG